MSAELWGYTLADPFKIVPETDQETAIARAAIAAYESGRPTRLYAGYDDDTSGWTCRGNVTPDGDVLPA